jgi:hypothetical protein
MLSTAQGIIWNHNTFLVKFMIDIYDPPLKGRVKRNIIPKLNS